MRVGKANGRKPLRLNATGDQCLYHSRRPRGREFPIIGKLQSMNRHVVCVFLNGDGIISRLEAVSQTFEQLHPGSRERRITRGKEDIVLNAKINAPFTVLSFQVLTDHRVVP